MKAAPAAAIEQFGEIGQTLLGKRLSEIAAERKRDVWDVYFQLLIDTGGRASALSSSAW